jgi:hypothetical protein
VLKSECPTNLSSIPLSKELQNILSTPRFQLGSLGQTTDVLAFWAMSQIKTWVYQLNCLLDYQQIGKLKASFFVWVPIFVSFYFSGVYHACNYPIWDIKIPSSLWHSFMSHKARPPPPMHDIIYEWNPLIRTPSFILCNWSCAVNYLILKRLELQMMKATP